MKDHSLYSIIPYKDRLLKFTEASSARVFYKNHSVDLLTGIEAKEGVDVFLSKLSVLAEDPSQDLRVIHLFYELGFLFEGLSSKLPDNEILAIDIQYTNFSEETIPEDSEGLSLSLTEAPDFLHYKRQFEAGYENLKEGNCYQFNLTGLYRYAFSAHYGPYDFIRALWKNPKKRGAYASATYSSFLNQLFLSNSPECLFQYHQGVLVSRPIKGTFSTKGMDKSQVRLLWKKLSLDKKSQAELYMITDLIRNDLCRIEDPSARVTKKKAPLLVPGLIHQYSEIEVDLGPEVTLRRIIESLFPGGSITGAPKKRVMDILFNLEGRMRGFYCGSTIIFRRGLIEASINIRSSVIDFKTHELSYQAGGGITLLSDVHDEFQEMSYKHNSYIDTITL